MLSLPTSTFPQGLGTVFNSTGPELTYNPGVLGESEVLFGMADRPAGMRGRATRSGVEDQEE
jgi:large subunit ribosomal protein L44